MKRLAVLMLGLGLAIGSVAVTFAQDTSSQAPKKKKKKGGGDTSQQKQQVKQQ
jgi:hypothetical protein